MANRRNLVIKCCLVAVSVYLCVYMISSNQSANIIRGLQQSGRNLAALDLETETVQQQQQLQQEQIKDVDVVKTVEELQQQQQVKVVTEATTVVMDPLERVREITRCLDRTSVPRTQQRGDYWVLYNYVKAERTFRCHESITYTTHADYTFMDNLVPLIERWRGPVSIALHAPGTDFRNTMDTIAYLRDCTTPLVKEYVTFHVYFSTRHVPKEVPRHNRVFGEAFNCSLPAPYANASSDQMYKTLKKLLYPVNVGRNVARETAQTHFILASDIELYPSPNVIPQFLEMIAENKGPLLSSRPKLYPFNLFEISATQSVPDNKTALKDMILNGTAQPFHKKLCSGCHGTPMSKEWMVANETKGLHVFHVGKRTGKFIHWEPIFIGTHAEPLYDERLSWEGKSDKMTQGYALCVLDYDFLILDNAFLVHKPGIKVYKKDPKRAALAAKTNQLIKKIIFPELKVIYGVKKGCAV
ncbi:PREDICTED: beta-1,4-glucuronyltransferase 1-like [Nicrophorus vespilloides]|uniref:Beta-1,4-glucuronyltransferase 1-like n=1 Tax=Nicrophorus vespilloides TaxID=110193 RepID=A0ABM1MJS7_NICVS|nr:PREDICTED: beta-1,4-glucuronyltransferase 1-like [Nicrophorus vespilloides]XP_017774827.1 PREDICTED: beta-1,4-glucuronyltransferase 1-like [Nicrophorus vespilloides]